jgi:two-component system, chemotaxis family, CheB/CheR fusion protein
MSAKKSFSSGEFPGQQATRRLPVVGIGASAGGLEAVSGFFKEVPADLGIAYVVVLHLDPARESKLTEILARTTPLPVVQVQDGMRVEPDHVYVIPPNCEMTIERWVLHLRGRQAHRAANTTIDTFFRSLAVDHGSDAIGVILSGTASDGTLGLAAIKGEAGITFAQEPSSAKYDGMPASAIASGCVDFILRPGQIAKEIARIRKHPYIAGAVSPDGQHVSDESEMESIFRLLRRTTTVDFTGYKSPTVARRVQRRMALHKMDKLSDYGALLHREPAEVDALYHDLLINVTSFFRNPEAFAALREVV